MTGTFEVVVVGGGYAGVMAANRLTQNSDVNVTLINPRLEFVERMRLHQLVGGSDDALADYSELLATRIRLIVDSVERVDAPNCRITLGLGGKLSYDYLVYAVGSYTQVGNVRGAKFAHPIATFESAQKLRIVISAAPLNASVTVVGSGLTGVETAAELAEQGRSVTLVCGQTLCPYLHPRGRRAVAKKLAQLKVVLVKGSGSRATALTHDAVQLADGRAFQSTVAIWTAGFSVPDLATRSGLSTDTDGRLLTDETLTSVDDIRIVAAGDCVAPSNLPYRMSAWAARGLGAHAADTVLNRIAGITPKSLNLGFYGVCVGLGRGAATVQAANKDDAANGLVFSGRLAALFVKEGGTRAVLSSMVREGRRPGSFSLSRKDETRPEQVRAKLAETIV